MSQETQSMLVVLHPGAATSAGQRPAEVPPAPDVVDVVTSWFHSRGFEVGPFVGISFAISGAQSLFDEVLGVDPSAHDQGDELLLDRLGDAVAPYVAALTTTQPPDFGPGNP